MMSAVVLGVSGFVDVSGMVGVDSAGFVWAISSWMGILTDLLTLIVLAGLTAGFIDLVVDFLGVVFFDTLAEEVAFLERRETSPSIDLFLSIVYNYNIMTVKLTKKTISIIGFFTGFYRGEWLFAIVSGDYGWDGVI